MSTSGSENDKTIGEAVAEHAQVLERTFNMSPETAAVSAQDKIAKGMRNPGSDAVDNDRAGDARSTADSTDEAE